jgi:hypothetical protein
LTFKLPEADWGGECWHRWIEAWAMNKQQVEVGHWFLMVLSNPGNRGTICLAGNQLMNPWLMRIAPNHFLAVCESDF